MNERPPLWFSFLSWLAILAVTQSVALGVGWGGHVASVRLLHAHHSMLALGAASVTVGLMLADIWFLLVQLGPFGKDC